MNSHRGYAHLGTGQYVINNTDKPDPAELVISLASEEEKANRQVGESRDNPPGYVIQPEQMCVRIRFDSVAALDALETQLQILRAEHFAASAPVDGELRATDEPTSQIP